MRWPRRRAPVAGVPRRRDAGHRSAQEPRAGLRGRAVPPCRAVPRDAVQRHRAACCPHRWPRSNDSLAQDSIVAPPTRELEPPAATSEVLTQAALASHRTGNWKEAMPKAHGSQSKTAPDGIAGADPYSHESTAAAVARLAAVVEAQGRVIGQQDAALARSREVFERASAAARLGLWECDLATETLQWSGGTYDMFTIARERPLVRRQALIRYPAESLKTLDRIRSRAIAERTGFTLDTDILPPDRTPLLTSRQIMAAMSRPIHCGWRRFRIGASVGLAVLDASGSETAMRRADAALYAAKAAGRCTFRWYDPATMRI